MRTRGKNEVRDLRNGDWYWIHKAVIRQYSRMVGATGILVYNFLASLADSSQACFPSQKFIAGALGYSRATVNRAIKALERHGLITIERRSRYHCIYKLVRVRRKAAETRMSNQRNSGVKQVDTNDNKLTRTNNKNIDMDGESISPSSKSKGFWPRTREELLALDLAKALNDLGGLAFYLSCARRYPESLLRRLLGEVRETPPEKIKKSRAALFNYLLKKYAQAASKNSGGQPGDKISGDSLP